jgi:hypothetical protein
MSEELDGMILSGDGRRVDCPLRSPFIIVLGGRRCKT